MSKLTKGIAELTGKSVSTIDYLENMALENVGPSIPLDRKIWPGYVKGIFSNVRIGGYGDPNVPFGAGPTRPMDHATYALRLIASRPGVPLTLPFGFLSDELEETLEWLNSKYALSDDKHKQSILREGNHLIIDSGSAQLNRNVPVYLEGIVTTVRKEGLSHRGDLSLYATIQLGSGLRYLTDAEYRSNDSLQTKDVLSNVTGTGARLRAELLRSMNILDVNSTEFGAKESDKRWLLTVDNV